MVPITGNTYPVREQLRKLGGRWDPKQKAWMVPEELAREAKELVASAPAPERMQGGRAVQTKRCWECGCLVTRAEVERNGGDWNEGVIGAGSCYCGC